MKRSIAMLKSLALAVLIALPTAGNAQNVGLFVHERYVLPVRCRHFCPTGAGRAGR
jgi:hypothetical protein